LVYLLSSLHLKRAAVKQLLKFGAVRVNGVVVRQFDHELLAGDEVLVGNLQAAVAIGQLQRSHIQLVYEDSALVVADKPAGLLTVATDRENADTLYVRLNAYLQSRGSAQPERAVVVHRIDKETSGLVLFAKNQSVKRLLQDGWPTVNKIYYAVVRGCPAATEGTINSYLTEDSKSLKVFATDHPRANSHLATTHYRVINTYDGLSLVEVYLGTGRKHQIRVQLASLGCPVVGDRRYGKRTHLCDRLALHAGELHLAHPLTGEPLKLTSLLPRALRKLAVVSRA
jgi:23S rRNA pseudouridine1911/1915/1917 synthase